MRKAISMGLVLCTAVSAPVFAEAPADAAMRVLDAFMEAFNARDKAALAETMHFPHVRIASGGVKVWETAEERMAEFDFDAFAERFGWDHSAWASREVVQSGENKVHIATTFVRYDADDREIARFDSMYVVSKIDGKWAIRARSSFAP